MQIIWTYSSPYIQFHLPSHLQFCLPAFPPPTPPTSIQFHLPSHLQLPLPSHPPENVSALTFQGSTKHKPRDQLLPMPNLADTFLAQCLGYAWYSGQNWTYSTRIFWPFLAWKNRNHRHPFRYLCWVCVHVETGRNILRSNYFLQLWASFKQYSSPIYLEAFCFAVIWTQIYKNPHTKIMFQFNSHFLLTLLSTSHNIGLIWTYLTNLQIQNRFEIFQTIKNKKNKQKFKKSKSKKKKKKEKLFLL